MVEETKEPKEVIKEEVSKVKKEESTALIDKAAAQADRLEAANKRQEELLARAEALEAKRALGGRADAGEESKPKSREEQIIEEGNKIMAGHGIDLNEKMQDIRDDPKEQAA